MQQKCAKRLVPLTSNNSKSAMAIDNIVESSIDSFNSSMTVLDRSNSSGFCDQSEESSNTSVLFTSNDSFSSILSADDKRTDINDQAIATDVLEGISERIKRNRRSCVVPLTNTTIRKRRQPKNKKNDATESVNTVSTNPDVIQSINTVFTNLDAPKSINTVSTNLVGIEKTQRKRRKRPLFNPRKKVKPRISVPDPNYKPPPVPIDPIFVALYFPDSRDYFITTLDQLQMNEEDLYTGVYVRVPCDNGQWDEAKVLGLSRVIELIHCLIDMHYSRKLKERETSMEEVVEDGIVGDDLIVINIDESRKIDTTPTTDEEIDVESMDTVDVPLQIDNEAVNTSLSYPIDIATLDGADFIKEIDKSVNENIFDVTMT